LSFKAKVSSTTKLDNVKAAVVAWSGTADTVTSDIISAWGAEGTDPTLIANATFENTPANLSVTTSYATYTLTANVDTASTKNLIVFIWSDVTDTTAGDFLYITDVQLEAGSTATDFERRPIGTELALCQRYFQQYNALQTFSPIAVGSWFSDTRMLAVMTLPTPMRSTPTINNSGFVAWAGANSYGTPTFSNPANSAGVSGLGVNTLEIDVDTTGASGADRNAGLFKASNNISAKFSLSAEL
jgi:hypothetical protein